VVVGLVEVFGREAGEMLLEQGFDLVFEATGMRAERVKEAAGKAPGDLQFSTRWGRKEIDEFVGVNMVANERPPEEGWAAVTSYFLLDPRCYPVVGEVGGQAVSAALAILLPEGLYLAWIATLPEWQGRGYGEATIREAIRRGRAASGHEGIFLHAPEPEQGLWGRLGLEAVGQFAGWGKGF
jgi:GNAT superfamily N-acetyltransferase